VPTYTTYALGESQISVSGGAQLSGITQGDGSHLVGETITLNSNAWEAVTIDDSEAQFDDSDDSQSLDGAQSFDGTSYSGGERVEAEYELQLQDPGGTTYTVLAFNINEAGSSLPEYGTVEGLAFVGGVGGFPPIGVPLTVMSAGEGPSQAYGDLATPICFTAGTLIATPEGRARVETLQVGDPVLTLDRGYQPIRWIGQRRLAGRDLRANRKLLPVRIRAGAFGEGLPDRDLMVSRQHRVLVNSVIVQRMLGVRDVLIPAIKLTGLDGVEVAHDAEQVEYWHLLFDQHHVVWSNGLPTESLFTGPEALKSVAPAARAEIVALFPELAEPRHSAEPARPAIDRGSVARRLVARHVRNNKPLVWLHRQAGA
jgi:hypothetical protein